MSGRYFITGGAGFIGAHLVDRLLQGPVDGVTVFDNLSTGRLWHLDAHRNDARLRIVTHDARDQEALVEAMPGHDIVYHLAGNSDIARAAVEPSIDFLNGTLVTHNVVESMRRTGVPRIVFMSGSGVYGEVPPVPVSETFSPMIPVSTYGAAKLASEALVSAYSFMFGFEGTVFRFANVVGGRQTHGVAFDFLKRLTTKPDRLIIYGDGTQSKPYIHVEDVLDALQLVERSRHGGYKYFNVGPEDWLTVREIADIVVARMGLKQVDYEFTGGARGWKADVPLYRLDTHKIRALGWANRRTSREALEASVDAMIAEPRVREAS